MNDSDRAIRIATGDLLGVWYAAELGGLPIPYTESEALGQAEYAELHDYEVFEHFTMLAKIVLYPRHIQRESMTIWYTADQHFGHDRVRGYCGRPFSSVSEMNEALVSRHNAVVQPTDVVWHLGDFSLDEKYVRQYLPRLNGKHRLLAGNHDACHVRRSKHLKMAALYMAYGFDYVCLAPWLSLEPMSVFKYSDDSVFLSADVGLKPGPNFMNGGYGRVFVSHMPPSEMEDPRYPEYRPPPESFDILLHGHVHERWKTKRLPTGQLLINVGVDVWDFTPVSSETLTELMSQESK